MVALGNSILAHFASMRLATNDQGCIISEIPTQRQRFLWILSLFKISPRIQCRWRRKTDGLWRQDKMESLHGCVSAVPTLAASSRKNCLSVTRAWVKTFNPLTRINAYSSTYIIKFVHCAATPHTGFNRFRSRRWFTIHPRTEHSKRNIKDKSQIRICIHSSVWAKVCP